MSFFSALGRLVFLILAVFSPFIVVAAWLGGARAAGIAAGASLLLGALLGLGLERRVRRVLGARRPASSGLARSLRLSVDQSPRLDPGLWVYEDPSPNVMLVRGWRAPGALFVSQGLLDLLTEEELRQVLAYCVSEGKRFETFLKSYAAGVLSLMMRAAPRGWVAVLWGRSSWNGQWIRETLSPFSFLFLTMVLPLARGIYRLAGGRERGWARASRFAESSFDFAAALRKIEIALEPWEYRPGDGLDSVALCRPGAASRLLSL
jgi:hypothetical protein